MCGIIGISGRSDAVDCVLAGLERLEYRGYDSAGVAVQRDGALQTAKRAGRLDVLRDELARQPLAGETAMGHTRWATHGAPVDRNAHPHADGTGRVQVVHNGIIENYEALRRELDGVKFASDTDSEVVAHLMARALAQAPGRPLLDVFRGVVARLEGAFSLCVMSADHPDEIVVAKHEAPLIVAHADGASYFASDVAALIAHTRDVASLLDGQLARITPDGVTVVDLDGATAEPHRYHVDWDVEAAEKGGYDHFMRKEIDEQPDAVRETLYGRFRQDSVALRHGLHGRLRLDDMPLDEGPFGRIDRVQIVACGTSLYAGMVGKLAIEHWAKVPVEVEVASEFRYRDPVLTGRTLVVAISQSGETSDTLAAAAHARAQGVPVLAIVNVVGSTLAREADAVLYTHAGPEIGVAATKTFLTQLVGNLLAALYLAQQRETLLVPQVEEIIEQLQELPGQIEDVLKLDDQVRELAERYKDVPYAMFIGRHAGLPVAFEGALKLKEISYVHAEAFAAGEMKHGPIALIEDGALLVAVAPKSHVFSKMISNIQEVRARGAHVLAVGTAGATAELQAHADDVITLPEPSHPLMAPVLATVPLQLFAYHLATARGEDVDKPRNLAKTVTVE